MAGRPNGSDIGFPVEGGGNMTLTHDAQRSPFHVLDHRWEGSEPVLILRRLVLGDGLRYQGGPVRIALSSMRWIDLRAGREVYCVGRVEDGAHIICEGNEVAEGFAQCMECLTVEIPDPRCIFEPHCASARCGAFFCQKEHVVYLAMYRSRMKVGMTQADRVMERATEQGADMVLPLARTKDRFSARALEKWLSSRGVPESVPAATVLKGLERRPPFGEMRDKALGYMERIRSQQILLQDVLRSRGMAIETFPRDMPSEVIVPGPYPIPERLEAAPRAIPADIVRGEVVGFKGKWGVVRSMGALAAFRVGDLVGRIAWFDGPIPGND